MCDPTGTSDDTCNRNRKCELLPNPTPGIRVCLSVFVSLTPTNCDRRLFPPLNTLFPPFALTYQTFSAPTKHFIYMRSFNVLLVCALCVNPYLTLREYTHIHCSLSCVILKIYTNATIVKYLSCLGYLVSIYLNLVNMRWDVFLF